MFATGVFPILWLLGSEGTAALGLSQEVGIACITDLIATVGFGLYFLLNYGRCHVGRMCRDRACEQILSELRRARRLRLSPTNSASPIYGITSLQRTCNQYICMWNSKLSISVLDDHLDTRDILHLKGKTAHERLRTVRVIMTSTSNGTAGCERQGTTSEVYTFPHTFTFFNEFGRSTLLRIPLQ
eukprot:747627-Hanusia_phi.AAC.3